MVRCPPSSFVHVQSQVLCAVTLSGKGRSEQLDPQSGAHNQYILIESNGGQEPHPPAEFEIIARQYQEANHPVCHLRHDADGD